MRPVKITLMSAGDALNIPVAVVADDRECRGPLPAVLAADGDIDLRVRRLAVGDYLVDRRFLFERKTLGDLAESIASGRLFKQALRLAEPGNPHPAIILEGTTNQFRDSGMSRESILGALVNISLFIGLPVLRSRGPRETARLFRYVSRQGRAIVHGAIRRPGQRPKGKAAVQRHLLQGLPGVGALRAAALLDQFGSVQNVVNADFEELVGVDGIGAKTARRIERAVREQTARYRVPA